MGAESRTKKGKKTRIIIILIAAFLFSIAGIIWMNMFRYTNPLGDYGVPYPFTYNGTVPRDFDIDGRTYSYNTDLVNILFIGYDELGERGKQGIGYQADTLLLAVFNKKTKDISIISIPRDSVTDFAVFDAYGNYAFVESGPVSLSYAYGENDKIRNDLTMAAVSNLMYQIPLNRYIAMNIDSIGPINDAVGGVTLTLDADFTTCIPEMEFSMCNPEMEEGKVYTLLGDDAVMYVRERQLPGMSGKDADRMKRQKQYVLAFVDTLKTASNDDPGVFSKLLSVVSGNVQTNLKSVELLFLLYSMRGNSFNLGAFEEVPGYMVDFHYMIDEDSLKQMIVDIFFI